MIAANDIRISAYFVWVPNTSRFHKKIEHFLKHLFGNPKDKTESFCKSWIDEINSKDPWGFLVGNEICKTCVRILLDAFESLEVIETDILTNNHGYSSVVNTVFKWTD